MRDPPQHPDERFRRDKREHDGSNLVEFFVRAIRPELYDNTSDIAAAKARPHYRADPDRVFEFFRDQVVERPIHPPRRHERDYRRYVRAVGCGQAEQSRFSSSARSVRSQVKSLSERPKCP